MKRYLLNSGWTRQTEGGVSENVHLPDDAMLTQQRTPTAPGGAACGFFPGGSAVYRKQWVVPAQKKGCSAILEFDGAYRNAEVSLNGEQLGVHPYGYTPIQYDVDEVLLPGEENELTVTTHCVQPNSRWYSGSGLYRQVSLWLGPLCHLRPWDVFLTTPEVTPEHSALCAEVTVTNRSAVTAEGTLTLSLQEKSGAVSCTVRLDPESRTAVRLTLPCEGVALWSAETPVCYHALLCLRTNLGTDESLTTVGFRGIALRAGDGLRVNGTPVKLLGGCLHHDNALLGAAAYPAAERRKLRKLKEAGYNAIRCAHNPPSRTFLELCDELGFYVIDEAFDCFVEGKTAFDYHLWFRDWWKRDLEAMVLRDRNHPSVLFWSIGNEITEMGGASGGVEWTRTLAGTVRALDPTRPVTAAFACTVRSKRTPGAPARTPLYVFTEEDYRRKPGETEAMALERAVRLASLNNMSDGTLQGEDVWGTLSREAADSLDAVGYNYYYRRYERDGRDFPNRIIIGTETFPSETYESYHAMLNAPNIIGDFIWTAWDNLGEAGAGRVLHDMADFKIGMLGAWPWLSCWEGDFDLDGNRRAQSYYRKILWGRDSGIHVFARNPRYARQKVLGLGWHWSDAAESWSWGEDAIGREISVEAYCDCDEVAFLVNDTEQARCAVRALKACAELRYQPGELRTIGYRNGVPVCEDSLRTAGVPAQIQLAADRSEIAADGMDLAFLSVMLLDADGIRVPTSSIELTAEVSGNALKGFGSGNPCTGERYGTGHRYAYGGRALLAIGGVEQAGEIAVTVSASGLPDASLTITAKPASSKGDHADE